MSHQDERVESSGPADGWTRWLTARAERFASNRSRTRPPRWVSAAIVIALGLGAWFSYTSLPDDVEFDRASLVALALLSIPGLVLNGVEYKLTAHLGGVRVSLLPAMRIALYGAAANLLPLPGASMVRIGAMRRSGAPLRHAATITVAVGLGWLGLSVLVAGLVLVPSGWVSVPFLVSGVLVLVVVAVVIARRRSRRDAILGFAAVLFVELCFVVMQGLRLWLALRAIGVSASPAQSLTLGVSNAVAAATGFLPGGLGIREALAAALGPIVGVDASTAFLAAVIDRVVALSVLGLLALPVLAVSGVRRRGGPPEIGSFDDPESRGRV